MYIAPNNYLSPSPFKIRYPKGIKAYQYNKWSNNKRIAQKRKKVQNTHKIINRNIKSLSIILILKELNYPIKESSKMDKKQESTIFYLKETHFSLQDTHKFQVKAWENIFHANGTQRKAWVDISEKNRF